MKKIVNPFTKISFETAEFDGNTNYGKFVVGPLERGFALTIGNSLRRVMLSSLPGASVFAIEVEGARHEFSALDGVEEDVTMIILSLKDLVLRIDSEDSSTKRLELEVEGPAVVTAADLVVPSDVTVVNPDLVLAHVAEGGKLKMSLFARNGRGYVTSEGNKALRTGNQVVGTIATDSNYSPITKVNYEVKPTRVGHNANYENLELEVWTNGSVLPQDSVALAAKILVAHFEEFLILNEITRDMNIVAEPVEQATNKYEDMTIEELDLSVRSYNCLKRAGIATVLELTQKTEEDMMKVRNLGKKSLKEVKEKLLAIGLSFKDYID
ncbi:MAG: DNA-directed RNA polymerase subunit alpha [Erysipelotrichales bacterium]|nr:DNA-directed RNA polymerase subunit alpha [Erysipelotrichales bacterium]